MADHGCVSISAQNVTDGYVLVTPSATPSHGMAKIHYTGSRHGQPRIWEHARVATPNGDDLQIDLLPEDVEGLMIWWWSDD